MLSDEWLSRYGLLENFNASVTRTVTRTRTGTGTWTTGVTAIALCTSCSRAKKYENILIECQDIRQNHSTMKLGHSDLGLLQGQRSCHTQTYFEKSLFINHLSTEI